MFDMNAKILLIHTPDFCNVCRIRTQLADFLEGASLQPVQYLQSLPPHGTEVAVVLDLMIHDIDIILHLIKSPVEAVEANGVAVVSETADIANARIRFENGCVANLTASRISQKKMRKMRMFQKDAYISVDFLDRETEIYMLKDRCDEDAQILGEIGVGDRKRCVMRLCPELPEEQGLEHELKVFIDAVEGKPSDGVTGEEGLRALKVARQVLQQLEGTSWT